MWWEFRQWRRQWLYWALFALGFAVILGSYVYASNQARQANAREYDTLLAESQQLADADKNLADQTQTEKVTKQRAAIQREQTIISRYGRALTGHRGNLLTHRLAYYRLLQHPAFPFSQRSATVIQQAITRDRYLQQHELVPQENVSALTPAAAFGRSQNAAVFLLVLSLLVLQFGGLFARDWETGSIRLLLMLPQERQRLSRHKLGLALVIAGSELVLWSVFGYLLAAIRSGQRWGGAYPWRAVGTRIVTLNSVLLTNMLTIILVSTLVIVLLYWLSILLRDRFTVIVAMIVVLGSGALFFGEASTNLLAALNPFYQLGLSTHVGLRNVLVYGTLMGITDTALILAALVGGHFWWRKSTK